MTAPRRIVLAALLGVLLPAFGLVQADRTASAATGSPFGVARPDSPSAPPTGGPFLWIAQEQSKFYRALSQTIRDARQDGSAVWLLVGLSFLYGIFHAAGPGHGKAVISSYIVSTGETLRRGLVLSSAAAAMQAGSAITLVLLLTLALRATAVQMADATFRLEAASYVAMAVLGAWLIVRKGRLLLSTYASPSLAKPSPALALAGRGWSVRRVLGGMPSGAAHRRDCSCAVPGADAVARIRDWRGAFGTVVAVGIRPCTGALVVLVFAIAQGLLWAGVLATLAMAAGTAITVGAIAAIAVGAKAAALRLADRLPGIGSRAVAAIELVAAVAVFALAVLLLAGLYAGGSSGG